MHEAPPQFSQLEKLLRTGGVSAQCAKMLVAELQDHYDDLLEEAQSNRLDRDAAIEFARRAIGSDEQIARAAAAQVELLSWSARYPMFANCGRSLVYAIALPAAPIYFCLNQASSIARWSASISLASLITGTLLLALQSLIG